MSRFVGRFAAPVRRRKQGLLLASTAIALITVDVGMAQAAADATPASSSLEEVVVTARKKVENIQNVPVAVTAITAKQLNNFALTSIEKIAATTPQLQVTRGSSGSGANISLNGIGSSFTSIGIEQSVAVDVDGVYYGQGRVLNEALFDMKQVEILKGPQSLFFGKNASAGVLSFSTADPTQTFEAMLRGSYETTAEEPTVEAYVSGPITDRFSARLAIHYSDAQGGYYHNLATAQPYTTLDLGTGAIASHTDPAPLARPQQEKDLVGRLTLKYEVTNNLTDTFKATLDSYHIDNPTANTSTFLCPGDNVAGTAAFGTPAGFRQNAPTEPCGKNRDIYQNNLPADVAAVNPIMNRHHGNLYQDYTSQAFTNILKYEGDEVTVESVTGYHHFINYFLGDYDFNGTVAGQGGVYGAEKSENQAFSSELRAQTKFKGPLNFMAGFLFQATQLQFHQDVIFNTGVAGIADFTNLAQNNENDYVTVEKRGRTNGDTYAGFAQVLWDITPELEFAAGGRYTYETKDSYFKQPYVLPAFQGVFVQAPPASVLSANQHFSNFSPEATLTWKPTSNITLYGSYKTGYKSGGFSISALDSVFGGGFDPTTGKAIRTPVSALAFKPETPKGVEGGVKTTLLDGSLRLNVDAFDYVYDNFQVDFFDSVHIDYITKNVGSAETRGIEAQFDWAPREAPGLRINGVLAYDDAFYSSFKKAPCFGGQTPAEGCTPNPADGGLPEQNLTGSRTQDAPNWTASLGADYERPIGSGLVIGVTGNLHYSSSYHLSQFGVPFDMQPDYVTLDAALRLSDEKHRWELAVIGKNLTDEFVLTSGLDIPNTGFNTGAVNGAHSDLGGTALPPRTIAVQFTWFYR